MNQAPASLAFFMHDLSGGGVERMRLRLAAGLAARGHQVALIVQSARGVLTSEVPGGIELFDLEAPRSWQAVPKLTRWLRCHRPDILISSLDHNNIAALCARRLAGGVTKVVICQHNALSAEAKSGWRYAIMPFLYRLLAPWADGIVAVSRGVADDLAETTGLPRSAISVIHNPVIVEQPGSVGAAPHAWLADRSVPVFLFVGRLVAQKNPALLVEALALRVQHGAARLIVLGDGPEGPALQALVTRLGLSDCTHFQGYVADPRPWMTHASALVLPSRHEGFGNVIVEALACGTPVIATDCPHGPAEILAGGRYGWLVPPGDVVALSAAMKDDARGHFSPARLIDRAGAYSVTECVDRHQSLIARLMRPLRTHPFGLAISGDPAESVCARMMVPTDVVRLVVTPNLDHLRWMRKLPVFASACRAADIICPDGFPIVAYANWRGTGCRHRVTGCDIFHELTRIATEPRKKVLVVAECDATVRAFDLWAKSRSALQAWTAIAAPPCVAQHVAGEQHLLAAISLAKPDILVMTLGAPVSEMFIHRNRHVLPPCWALCCGQAVRVELGLTKRTPVAWQKLNLEWAWRLCLEPRRLGPRYLRDACLLPVLIWQDLRCGAARLGIGSATALPLQDHPGT